MKVANKSTLMIGNSLLLDTSVIIDLWRSDDKVIDFLEKQQTFLYQLLY